MKGTFPLPLPSSLSLPPLMNERKAVRISFFTHFFFPFSPFSACGNSLFTFSPSLSFSRSRQSYFYSSHLPFPPKREGAHLTFFFFLFYFSFWKRVDFNSSCLFNLPLSPSFSNKKSSLARFSPLLPFFFYFSPVPRASISRKAFLPLLPPYSEKTMQVTFPMSLLSLSPFFP